MKIGDFVYYVNYPYLKPLESFCACDLGTYSKLYIGYGEIIDSEIVSVCTDDRGGGHYEDDEVLTIRFKEFDETFKTFRDEKLKVPIELTSLSYYDVYKCIKDKYNCEIKTRTISLNYTQNSKKEFSKDVVDPKELFEQQEKLVKEHEKELSAGIDDRIKKFRKSPNYKKSEIPNITD